MIKIFKSKTKKKKPYNKNKKNHIKKVKKKNFKN